MPSDFALALSAAGHVRPVPVLRPLTPFHLAPASPCPHKVKIKRGSVMVCLVCFQSGQDHRLADMPGRKELHPETGEPPRPEYARAERTVYAPPPPKRGAKLTRRQKRAAMRAAVEVVE